MKITRPLILSTLLVTSMLANVCFATTNDDESTLKSTLANQTVNPTVTFWGLGGKQLIGSGQGLIPLTGGGTKSIFYGAIEAAGSFKKSNGYLAGIAAGFRNVINDSYILGSYLFADYNRSAAGHSFWVANPGLEALGSTWDLRVNGYIPTTCQHWLGGETLAENIGITKFERAFAHERYDHLFQLYEEVGPGLDAEVGRHIQIAKNYSLKIHLGGYHYFMDKTDTITGVESRIVYPLTKYASLEARDSYDKVRKNVFMLGIKLSFGGYNNDAKDSLGVSGRLADPIEHNFGNFGSANSIAVGNEYVDEDIEYHLPGAFWYFDNAINNKNSSGDGTYEHPFNAIDLRAYQLMTNSGAFSQNVQMYVATGLSVYDLSGMPDNRLPLLSGYSIYGRTANFTRAAKGSLRPELDGGITAYGDNHNISDIQLQSQNYGFGKFGTLYLHNAQNVNINDVNINVSENNTDAFGISAVNSSATINNSAITVNSSDNSKQSFGINLKDSALFVQNNNYIHATLISTDDREGHAGGIVYDGGTVTIFGNNNQIIADGSGSNSRAIGILDTGHGTLTISGNSNHITASADGHDSRAGGIMDVGKASTTIISGNNNQIIANTAGLDSKALGIGELGFLNSGIVTVSAINKQTIISGSNNQIIANSAESNSIGILNAGGVLIISGNNNQIIANSATKLTGHECNAGGIINLGDLLTISGNNNKISANSAGNSIGIMNVGGTTVVSGNHNQIRANSANESVGIMHVGNMLMISGDNNQISANSAGSATGIANVGDILTISGNNNRISANSTESEARGILDAGILIISGNNNYIAAHAASNAYGIYLDPSIVSPVLSVKNTIFNIVTTNGDEAAGISLGTLTDASNIIIQGNIFNVAASGANSHAYGLYLPHATTPASIGNIAANIFNITNFKTPENAWGVYANSSWSSAAVWIRAHNVWLNPTSKNPQQQVYTDGTGIANDIVLNTINPYNLIYD